MDINPITFNYTLSNSLNFLLLLARIDSIETMTIKQVMCGQDFTLALSDKGKVLSWGNNRNGQLGHSVLGTINRPR
jgi:alpha-tubulin suppressor-like RCC1 family protein